MKVVLGLFVSLFLWTATDSARANVYATDIKINGSLMPTNYPAGTPVTISYRLNQSATAGVTVNILQGSTTVASITGGTSMGLNSVSWTPNIGGTFTVSISAGATGFPVWTQISVDSNPGMPAFYPLGIDVDKNTNSPYYGRVIMGCATRSGTSGVVPPAAQMTGLYKMNADGSQADEGWYGNANYLHDDGGDQTVSGQVPDSFGFDPYIIRIGNDDRIYWCDDSAFGAIIACDMLATTNQVVIDDGTFGELGGSSTYVNNPDFNDLRRGIQQFDVIGTGSAATALFLCDVDSPNWGVWMYHLKNGVADPADTEGTQAIISSSASDLNTGSSGGCMVDANLDIYVSQNVFSNLSVNRTMQYTLWNNGVLPPEAGGSKYAFGTTNKQVHWAVGSGDSTFEAVQDTVISSRQTPAFVALPMTTGTNNRPGIRVLNAANGSVVSVTNGSTVQTLTNLDYPNDYTCAAWDNVGNLYGASTSRNLWRVWSPPGANQATTVAAAQIVISGVFEITNVTEAPTTSGCATVTLSFTAPGNPALSSFHVMAAPTVNGTYKTLSSVSISGSSGNYQAVFTNCTTQFFIVEQ
jgi:hypothetical protein